jgi:sodium-independent sulfate anion transporter 11
MIKSRHSLLYFPAIEWMRNRISKAIKEHGNIPVVLDCRLVNGEWKQSRPLVVKITAYTYFLEFDFTVGRGINDLRNEMQAKKIPFIVLGASPDIKVVLKESLKTPVIEAGNEMDLDRILAEIQHNGNQQELREVITPLLSPQSQGQAPLAANENTDQL